MGRSGAVGTPGPQPTWPLPPWVDPGGPPEWVSCPSGCPAQVGVPPEWVSRSCAELCSDPRRVSLAAGQPRAGCGFSALGAAAPAARRPPGLGCGAVTCPWPSSGASSGGNVCLPALQRNPPHQPAPSPPAGPRMGEMGRSPQLHAAPSASSACSSLAAAASGWLACRLGRGHLDAGPPA